MHHREREIVGLTALARRVTPIAQGELGGDHGPMLRNPIVVCLTLAAIVVLAAIAEAAVVLTSRRRRRIAW